MPTFNKLFARRPAPGPHEPWQSEADDELIPIRRQLVIIRAKAPFLQWLKRANPECEKTLAMLRAEAMAYLVPIGEGDVAEAKDFVDDHYGRFFAQELSGWIADASQWPAERSLKQFHHWFDIEVLDMVLDVAK